MIVDTRTKESLLASFIEYLQIDIDRLFSLLLSASQKARQNRWCFDSTVFDAEIQSSLSNLHLVGSIDEIYVYHLTRRLNSDDSVSSDNLRSLLLDDSVISAFLKQHGVSFIKLQHPILCYKGKEVNLNDTFESDACYLRNRLGYNAGRVDYCFNGFAFKDRLMKNSYTRELYDGPEFINVLSRYLKNSQIIKDYFERSKYYCYTYKLKLDEILFDEDELMNDFEKVNYFISKLCYRILENKDESNYFDDFDNPIIRISDESCVSPNAFVEKEEITLDKIR